MRGGHQGETCCGEEDDGDKFGRVAEARGAAGEGQRNPSEHEDTEAGRHGEFIEDERAAENGASETAGERAIHRGDNGGGARDDRKVEATLEATAAAKREVEGEHEERADDERRFGHHGAKKFSVVHSEPPFSAACMNGDWSAGMIQSRSTSGLRPM